MKHYILDTHHGPLIITQRETSWIISSLHSSPEVFEGAIPSHCIENARAISTVQAMKVLRAGLGAPAQSPQRPRRTGLSCCIAS